MGTPRSVVAPASCKEMPGVHVPIRDAKRHEVGGIRARLEPLLGKCSSGTLRRCVRVLSVLPATRKLLLESPGRVRWLPTREVHFGNDGRYVDPDELRKNPNDKRWTN
jgi:hypothetical protein